MKQSKVLVIGEGFIGKPLTTFLGADTTAKRLNELVAADLNPYDVVINCAAKTTIDWCEKNREETFDTNVIQAVRLAKLTKGKYVFFSSACIFKSDSVTDINYEDSVPNPQCFYTYTKLMAEQLIQEVKPDTLIIRPRLIISEKPHPRNTINKLLTYDKVLTTQESATVLEDLIPKVAELIANDEKGPFNIFNAGTISPAEIMITFRHKHLPITKAILDEVTQGKARRVCTVLGSKRTTALPHIWSRIEGIYKNWNK